MNLSREEIKMRCDFLKSQKYTFEDLQSEVSKNHYSTAHRLAHTLKGVAGLIKERKLTEIALMVEQQLKNNFAPHDHDMTALEDELNRVLTEITDSGITEMEFNVPPTLDEQTYLFNQLQNLLTENNAACTELIPEIMLIPETKVLVYQIENYEFEPALVTLEILRKVLGV
jgi:HPt (histidine-containing phosphotransfer) domain-containing protein